MAAKYSDTDIPRLCRAVERDRLSLERFRSERREAIREYIGHHYSPEGTKEKRPVNLLAMYVSIVSRALVAKNPRVMLSTFDRAQRPAVQAMESWCNQEIEAMDLVRSLERFAYDGLFGLGVMKVALSSATDASMAAWNLHAGQPFAKRVSLDDFSFDFQAGDLSECWYVGHRYRAVLEYVKENKTYDKKARDRLVASSNRNYNEQGDQRASTLGRGTVRGNDDEAVDYVDLWEIYLPHRRCVYTLSHDELTGAGEDILEEKDFIGPDRGPYHFLALGGLVPDNAVPKAPVQDLIDQHVFANRVYRKLMDQAERQKEVLPVRSGASEDGERLLETPDGFAFRCDSDNPKAVSFGGPNQMNMAAFMQAKELFSWQGDNLNVQGGLSPEAKTLGQERLLSESSGATVAAKQAVMVAATTEILDSLCWYFWHDPRRVMRAEHEIVGLGETVPMEVHPYAPHDAEAHAGRLAGGKMMRQGPVPGVKVDPYSMQHQTPQERIAALDAMVQNVLTPMMPMIQASGKQFNVVKYLTLKAKYSDQPDLLELFDDAPPPDPNAMPAGPPSGGAPANTSRTYERVSRPGRTPSGNAQNMISTLMGVNPGGAAGGAK